MNIHLRTMRLKAQQCEQGATTTMTHEQLVERARALGCPPFCGSWPTETLIRKIKEKENASS